MAGGSMETERVALSQRERERLKVLHEVKQKHLTQAEAAQRLKVTDRQVRRLLLALEERGDGAVVHGLRGRPSNRKLDASFEQRILARVRRRYADFTCIAGVPQTNNHGFHYRSSVQVHTAKHGLLLKVSGRLLC